MNENEKNSLMALLKLPTKYNNLTIQQLKTYAYLLSISFCDNEEDGFNYVYNSQINKSEVARELHFSRITFYNVVESLEKMGFIERTPKKYIIYWNK